jgi:hypothetical protein
MVVLHIAVFAVFAFYLDAKTAIGNSTSELPRSVYINN